MPIIVLEGPDGSGKTTVAKLIEAAHPGVYVGVKCGPPEATLSPYLQYCDVLDDADALDLSGKIVVIDRLHLGELVYGPMFRGRSRLSWMQTQAIEERLQELQAVKALFMPSTDELIRRHFARDGGKRDEKSGAGITDAQMIRARYAWCESMLDDWFMVDTSTYPQQVATDLLEMATQRRR